MHLPEQREHDVCRQIHGIVHRDPASGTGLLLRRRNPTGAARIGPIAIVIVIIVRGRLRRELWVLFVSLPFFFLLLLLLLLKKFVLEPGGPFSDFVHILPRQILHDNGRCDGLVGGFVPIRAHVMPHVRGYCVGREDVVQEMQNRCLAHEDTGIFEIPNLDFCRYEPKGFLSLGLLFVFASAIFGSFVVVVPCCCCCHSCNIAVMVVVQVDALVNAAKGSKP
jgi:hypothetical protein